ncbi:MAG: hypothetical protein QME52_13050 [Bacteroidota bacterium]|nr:hypothetical protein [Bacteroidota bacterium]
MSIFIKLFFFFVVTVLVFHSWGCEKPDEPPVPSDCEINNTASVRFENRSSYTIDVVLNGVRIAALNKGNYSDQIVAAGVQCSV